MSIHHRYEEIKQEVPYLYSCDSCGKEIEMKYLPNNWYEITTGHHGWGKDSCESISNYHLCSIACLLDKICENDNEEDGSRYIKIKDLNDENIKELIKNVDLFKNIDDIKQKEILREKMKQAYENDIVEQKKWVQLIKAN